MNSDLIATTKTQNQISPPIADRRIRRPYAFTQSQNIDSARSLVRIADGVLAVAQVEHIGVAARPATERVITGVAAQRVRASAANEGVGCAVAGQYIVLCIAGAVDGGSSGEDEVFQVRA